MRVLILGGTRFIGRRITTALMARGDDVTVVHRGDHEPAVLPHLPDTHLVLLSSIDVYRAYELLRPRPSRRQGRLSRHG